MKTRGRPKKKEQDKIKSQYVRIDSKIMDDIKRIAGEQGTSPRKYIESVLSGYCRHVDPYPEHYYCKNPEKFFWKMSGKHYTF